MAVNNNTVTIGHTAKLNIVVYRNEKVLTFGMIDKAHARKEDTAKKRFFENKKRFIEGKHYHMVQYAEAEALKPYGVEVPPRGLTLITKRGYLLLVKSFTDDLAWEVQEQLVDFYFERTVQAISSSEAPEITHVQYEKLIQKIGMIAGMLRWNSGTAKRHLTNKIRFDYNLNNLRDLSREDYGEVMATLQMIDRFTYQNWLRFIKPLEEQYIKDFLCERKPLTGTIKKQWRKTFEVKFPSVPDWPKLASEVGIEAALN